MCLYVYIYVCVRIDMSWFGRVRKLVAVAHLGQRYTPVKSGQHWCVFYIDRHLCRSLSPCCMSLCSDVMNSIVVHWADSGHQINRGYWILKRQTPPRFINKRVESWQGGGAAVSRLPGLESSVKDILVPRVPVGGAVDHTTVGRAAVVKVEARGGNVRADGTTGDEHGKRLRTKVAAVASGGRTRQRLESVPIAQQGRLGCVGTLTEVPVACCCKKAYRM